MPTLAPADPDLARAVAALVNERYAATEAPLWPRGWHRTDVDEVLALARDGLLLHVCEVPGEASTLLGAVCVHLPHGGGGGTAELGMLAVAPAAAGRGLGTRLVRAAEALAEQHGAGVVELEVLRPASGTLEAKERLAAWYPRLGYRLVASTPADRARPDLVAELAVPCTVDRYRRWRAPSAPTVRPAEHTEQESPA